MKHILTPLALTTALLLSLPARAADIDWKKVDAALGKTAAVSGEVHRYGLPRSDLHVTLDGVAIKPALALGGWVAFAPMQGEAMLMGLKDVAVSSGSACTSASLEPSYVLRALGVEEELAHTSIRFGLGRFNTEEEVDFVIEKVVDKVNKLREMSPLYEMAKAGIDLKSIQWAAH